jgi:predicted TIM-barrel fold metal-dependent hydrolase
VTGLPIVDAHQHFWEATGARYPWLSTAPLPAFRYGDYAALPRRYLPEDFRRDAAGHRVVATVHMEAEWDPADEVGETRWLAALRKEHGLPTAAVGHARFDAPGVDEVLAGHAAFDFMRGIRHKPAAAASPAAARRGAPGSMDDPVWRRGYARLERHRLHFDVQTPWWHLDALADLARDFPRIPVVINHTALPADRRGPALAAWRHALERAAAQPNVTIKISGLGQPDKSWPVEGNRQIVRDTLAIFGPARCMFASNFPVDGLCVGYHALFDAFESFVADRPQADQCALFHDNAVRIYRLAGV